MLHRHRILLVGPPLIDASGAYGGGTGGYTRNMAAYLATFGGDAFELLPFYHSVRGGRTGLSDTMPVRMLLDTIAFFRACLANRPDAVHILAQYRGALAREYAQALICRTLRIPFSYDVKAGAFAASFAHGTRIYRHLLRRVIAMANLLFAEGGETKDLLRAKFRRDAVFFPNFVPECEIPQRVPERLRQDVIRLLFVGYCTRGKGVFELVEGVSVAAEGGMVLELDIIGAESEEFTSWIDALPPQPALTIRRHGRQPHPKVLEAMQAADIYAYPTSYPGEGHNNSINEAMMSGLIILTTRHGFLADVLDGGCGYFLDSLASSEIADKLHKIAADRDAARAVAHRARLKLIAHYSGIAARERFRKAYSDLLRLPNAVLGTGGND